MKYIKIKKHFHVKEKNHERYIYNNIYVIFHENDANEIISMIKRIRKQYSSCIFTIMNISLLLMMILKIHKLMNNLFLWMAVILQL